MTKMDDDSTFSYQALPPEIRSVLKDYRIIDKSGNPTQTKIRARDANGNELGEGPLVDPEVIRRLISADSTPDKQWLPWMLFQAAGGKEAERRSQLFLPRVKDRFIKEKRTGVTKNGVFHPPVSEAEAQRLWEENKAAFEETILIADQDMLGEPHYLFGFARHWPGNNRIYEQVATAVKDFQKLQRKAVQMNTYLRKTGEGASQVKFTPKDYASVADLISTTKRIVKFFNAKNAREDVRIQTIYDDDILTVTVPLTYAAASRYGVDTWPFAERGQFERYIRGEGSEWNNPWKDHKVYVYIQFNVAVPSWVVYSNSRFKRYSLRNLAIAIPYSSLKTFDEDSIEIFDEENKGRFTLNSVKEKIADAANAVKPDRSKEEYPISGYSEVENAEEIVKHFEAAMDAVKAWASNFDPKTIIRNPLT